MIKKLLKNAFLAILIVLLLAQFFGPQKNDGDLASVEAFFEDTNPPEDVKLILKDVCFDCHSDHTRYPWYNAITPVNYWLADHIRHGKRSLNVSKWNNYTKKKKDHKLEELVEEVQRRHMPLSSYTWTHSDATLTDAQVRAVTDWVQIARLKYVFVKEPQ